MNVVDKEPGLLTVPTAAPVGDSLEELLLASYKKQVAAPTDAKTSAENPWIKKMRLHCEEYIRDADKLAASADQFAEFHTMRAAELKGK